MSGLYNHNSRGSIVLTPAIYNADHQNHIDNHIPEKMDDYSADNSEMQERTDPGEVGTESRPTNLAGEITRLRQMIYEITVKLNPNLSEWYESPGATGVCLITMAGSQVVTTATVTAVAFDTANTDTLSDYDTLTYRWTPSVPGYYWHSTQVRWSAGADGSSYQIYLRKNGSSVLNSFALSNSTAAPVSQVSGIVYANGTTDYFDVAVYHNSGSDKSVQSTVDLSYWHGGRLV